MYSLLGNIYKVTQLSGGQLGCNLKSIQISKIKFKSLQFHYDDSSFDEFDHVLRFRHTTREYGT